MWYRALVRPILYLLPAETAHHLAIFFLKLAQIVPGGLWLLRQAFRTENAPVEALGLSFDSAIGLAAGFDKNAEVFPALASLGFGFVEVGTITAQGQPGNPRPRLFRLPPDQALVNRMGFNNHGAKVVAQRLRALRASAGSGLIVGVNIGKTKLTPADQAADDYVESARLLTPLADYLVVNVSSPNTPGLRDLQEVERLRPILIAVRQEMDRQTQRKRVPLLVKIAPDLADSDVIEVAHLADQLALDGIIATNTTIARSGLISGDAEVESVGAGGLSGMPLKARSLEVLRLLKAHVKPSTTLIAAGGLSSASDVAQRLEAGADLVQIYSALVYQGPGLPSRLCRELAALRG